MSLLHIIQVFEFFGTLTTPKSLLCMGWQTKLTVYRDHLIEEQIEEKSYSALKTILFNLKSSEGGVLTLNKARDKLGNVFIDFSKRTIFLQSHTTTTSSSLLQDKTLPLIHIYILEFSLNSNFHYLLNQSPKWESLSLSLSLSLFVISKAHKRNEGNTISWLIKF